MALSDLIYKLAYAEAGGDEEKSTDKLNKVFGSLSTVFDPYLKQRDAGLDREKKALEAKKIQQDMLKSETETNVLKNKEIPLRFKIGESPEQTSALLRSEFEKEVPGETVDQRLDRISKSITQRRDTVLDQQNKYGDLTTDQYKDLSTADKNFRWAPSEKKQPLSTQGAIESGYASREFVKSVIPDLADSKDISVGELQSRLNIKKMETLEGTRLNRDLLGQQFSEARENRAKLKDELKTIVTQQQNLNVIKDQLSKIPPSLAGGTQSLIARSGQGFKEAATYDKVRKAYAVSLYRAMTGDTRLSDADAESRALPLIPTTIMDQGQRDELLGFIEEALEVRKKNAESGISNISWDDILFTAQDRGIRLGSVRPTGETGGAPAQGNPPPPLPATDLKTMSNENLLRAMEQ